MACGAIAGPEPPPVCAAAVVVDASAVVVVDGSVTIVGPGRASVVVVDLPITRPRCDWPVAQPAAVSATATAAATAPVLRRPEGIFMGKWSTFPEGVELLGMTYTSARESQGVHW